MNNVNWLIYKTGYTETFVNTDPLNVVSLGDIVRTLQFLKTSFSKNNRIIFLTGKCGKKICKALPSFPKKFRYTTRIDLKSLNKKNTNILNLERNTFSKRHFKLSDKNHFGLLWNGKSWSIKDKDQNVYSFSEWKKFTESIKVVSWNDQLRHLTGTTKLDSNPKTRNTIKKKCGLNWLVGKKWPSKQLTDVFWKKLEHEMGTNNIKSDWQRGTENISEYFAWIKSCGSIVTSDSLGMHLAEYFEIPSVALFGPTDHKLVSDYDYIKPVYPEKLDFACYPCYQVKCTKEVSCASSFRVERVIRDLL